MKVATVTVVDETVREGWKIINADAFNPEHDKLYDPEAAKEPAEPAKK